MKVAGIWREAYRNIITGTSRVALFTVLLALVSASLAVVDLLQIRALTDAAHAYQRAGASIAVLEAPGRVDGTACSALTRVPGIRAAGAIRTEEQRLTLSLLPGAPVPVSAVTPGFPALLYAETSAGAGLYLSDQVAQSLQALPGDEVMTRSGTVRVAGVYEYPNDGRAPGYGYMSLVPVPEAATFDACWADIWPQSDATRGLLLTTLTGVAADEQANVTLSSLNPSLGAVFPGVAEFERRLTRFAPIAAGIVALGLGYVSIRVRRLEIASHLHAGVSRRDQRHILTIETGAWVLLAIALMESAIGVTIALDSGGDRVALILIAQRVVFTALIGASAGALIAWLSTHEKHLFTYFKRR